MNDIDDWDKVDAAFLKLGTVGAAIALGLADPRRDRPVPDQGGVFLCPWSCSWPPRKNAKKSLLLLSDGEHLYARCFSCEISGDVFDLVAATHGFDHRTRSPSLLRAAARIAGVTVEAPAISDPVEAAIPVDSLRHHPESLRGPAVARPSDEAALVSDMLAGRASLEALEMLVPDDFTHPTFRDIFEFCVERMRRGESVNRATLEADLAERWKTDTARVREILRPIRSTLDGPRVLVLSAAARARSLREVGLLRRIFAAVERLDLEARAVARTSDDFDAASFRERLREDVRRVRGSSGGSK